ncbi:MAG: LptF/LptG family permease [Planctomycetia bacterium]|nr:LptF/LptG family permease [Planctomycetia bacterium]
MATMDRYLLRQFLWVLGIFFSSFLGMYVVADLVNNYDELAAHAAGHGGIVRVVAEYYGQRSLSFFDQTSPLLILIASMFTVAAFRRHNEMTALLAAGISKARIVKPIIAAAVLVTALAAVNREVCLPALRQQLSYNAQDLSENHLRDIRAVYDNETDIQINGAGLVVKSQEIDRPSFFLPRALGRYGQQLTAKRARYLDGDQQHPPGYLLMALQQPSDLLRQSSLKLGDRPIIVTPRDAPWLKPNECFVVSRVDFEQLTGGSNMRMFSSTYQLIAGLRNPSLDYGAGTRVTIHSRVVQPLLDMTLLFLGLPLVLSRENRNLFAAVGLCVLVVLLFMMVTMACHYLGENLTISPAMAAWCPLLLFVPLAAGMSEPLLE